MAERAPLNILLVILAGAPLILTVVDFVLAQGNQSLRAEVDQRRRVIDQAAQLAHANQTLIRQIAVTAVKSRDNKLRELLSQNGITINVTPPAPTDDAKGG